MSRHYPQQVQTQFDYDPNSNEIVKHLVFELNKLRKANRCKKLYRNKLGDCVATQLHDQGVTKQDANFTLRVQEMGLFSTDCDFVCFEARQEINTAHTDVKQIFIEVLRQKTQTGSLRNKLVCSKQYSHASMTLKQSGIRSDVFQIGVLLFKAAFTVERVFESSTGEGALIAGRVLDPSLKPCTVMLNRGDPNLQCALGPNLISYEANEGDEYKVHVPREYLRMPRHPILGCGQPLIEVYGTSTTNRQVKLANQMDVYEKQYDADQRHDPIQMKAQGIEPGLRTFMVPSEDFKGLPMITEQALLPQTSLLGTDSCNNTRISQIGLSRQVGQPPAHLTNRLNQKTVQPRNALVGNNVQPPATQLRKTRAQLLREEANARKRDNPSVITQSVYTSANFGGNQTVNHSFAAGNKSQMPCFQPQPQAQPQNFAGRSRLNSTFNRSPMNQNSLTPSHSQGKPPHMNGRGQADLFQSAISQVSLTPRQTPNQQTNFVSQQHGSQAQPQFHQFQRTSQSQSKPKFQFNSTQQPQQSSYQQSQSSTFQWPQQSQPKFQSQPQTQPFQPSFKFQPQQQTVAQSANGFQPISQQQRSGQFAFGSQLKQPIGFSQAPQPLTQMQQVDMTMQGGKATELCNSTPIPVRFTVTGTQSKRFDSKKSHQESSLLPLHLQQDFYQQQLDFNSLCAQDQETLKGYLKELCEFGGSQAELEGAEKLMYTNPVQFNQMYCQAKQFVKSQEEQTKAKQLESQSKEAAANKPLISVKDFSDTHLFLVHFAEKVYACSKYMDKPRNTQQVLRSVTDPDNSMTAAQGLEQIILSRDIPRNDNFVKLYSSWSQPADLKLVLHRESFKCHQFVLQSSSHFMRVAIQENQKINVRQLGQRLSSMTFTVPDWVTEAALNNYIRFCYTTEFKIATKSGGQSALRKERPQEACDLFRLACYFQCESLQECLLAREILPNMNAYSAILFLQEVSSAAQTGQTESRKRREAGERAKLFLIDYCKFYLAKNMPIILRQERHQVLSLSQHVIYELVRDSLFFVVDASADIEILLDFAASVIADKDLFKLFSVMNDRMSSCCGFSQQHIPKMEQICEQDPDQPLAIELMQGHDYSKLQAQEKGCKGKIVRQSDAFTVDKPDKTAQNYDAQRAKQGESTLNSSVSVEKVFGPSKNVKVFHDGQAEDSGPIREPTFELLIDLTQKAVSEYLEPPKSGLSFFSESFNVARRSWHLKVDIEESTKEISLWLVERGPTQGEKNPLEVLRRSIPIKFSSVLAEMQIVDPGLKHRKSAVFFSFAHDQCQVIGHKGFACLDQLADKAKLLVRVKVFEHVLHSAIVHLFATSFQNRFKKEVTLASTLKMLPYTQQAQQLRADALKSGFFTQSVPTVYWLLSSDMLKVEDENTVLSFVHHYTEHVRLHKGLKDAVLAAEQLSKSLRFNFLDLYNLLSATRKNQAIQASLVVRDTYQKEVQERLKLKRPGIARIYSTLSSGSDEAQPEEELYFCGRARHYFNMQKVEGQGRLKLVASEADAGLALADEFLQWTFESRIQEIQDNQAALQPTYQLTNQIHADQAQIRILTAQLNDERLKAHKAAQELQDFQRRVHSQFNYADGKTAHLSDYQRNVAPTPAPLAPSSTYYNPMSQKYDSPPKYVPTSLGLAQKENIQPPQKLYVQEEAGVNKAHQAPLYAQPKPQAPLKRDPPAFLGSGAARQPPTSLMNKSIKSEQLVQAPSQKQLGNFELTKASKPPASLNLSLNSNAMPAAANRQNTSMDLSAIMNKLNQSPAPSNVRKRPATKYLASQKGGKDNCLIF